MTELETARDRMTVERLKRMAKVSFRMEGERIGSERDEGIVRGRCGASAITSVTMRSQKKGGGSLGVFISSRQHPIGETVWNCRQGLYFVCCC